MNAHAIAAQKRSIRTIRTELDFLVDSSVLTSQQVSAITALLPDITGDTNGIIPQTLSATPAFNNARTSQLSEKASIASSQQQQSSHNPPPQAVHLNNSAPIAAAIALYAYQPADAGDLALQWHDRVLILEYMNADWARGRNERTGDEGIFPRSYVTSEGKEFEQASGSGYGNVPVEVANGNSNGHGVGVQNGEQQQPNKINEQGKKFGKKLGNAAVFGAGATIGSNIVNSIF